MKIPVNQNKDGMMKIWLPVDKNDLSKGGAYKRVHTVDAREMMELSGALMKAPEDSANDKSTSEIKEDAEKDIMKTSKKDLIKIIEDENLTVDLDSYEKLGEKREAVQNALIEKAQQE